MDEVEFIRSLYPNENPVPLHSPVFIGNETQYVMECINSTYVSYIGTYVIKFEEMTSRFTDAKFAIAVVNGTTALQVALQVAGVTNGNEVITQPLTFVATANAISHVGGVPIFVDVDLDTMGMSPTSLLNYLRENCVIKNKTCFNRTTGRAIAAVVPMHTFGNPCKIDQIVEIAADYYLPVIEDAAESIGSFYKGKHTGTFGLAGIISYNGNKTITTGGGGMILTNNETYARKVRHVTTTGKMPHKWEYVHDIVAYNYRLNNLCGALGVAQMECLENILVNKRETSELYNNFFQNSEIKFFTEPQNSKSNYWLNAIQLDNKQERDNFLAITNSNGVMTRPVWRLMSKLKMYKKCHHGDLSNSIFLENRLVNIPSGYRQKTNKEI